MPLNYSLCRISYLLLLKLIKWGHLFLSEFRPELLTDIHFYFFFQFSFCFVLKIFAGLVLVVFPHDILFDPEMCKDKTSKTERGKDLGLIKWE